MGSLFSKPKMPDTSAQEKRMAEQDARLKEQEDEQKRREASMQTARGRNSRRSILLSGPETGLRESLG